MIVKTVVKRLASAQKTINLNICRTDCHSFCNFFLFVELVISLRCKWDINQIKNYENEY